MKIVKQIDIVIKALQDFLNANPGKVDEVANKGKFILEITDSQIKGVYKRDGKEEKLKGISYQISK